MFQKTTLSTTLLPSLLSQDALFIDLREKKEYDNLHIHKFINIPFSLFNVYTFKPLKQPVYLICYSGHKSEQIANQLRQKGIEAYSFSGGFYTFYYSHNHSDYY